MAKRSRRGKAFLRRSAAAKKGWETRRRNLGRTALRKSQRTKTRQTKKTPYRYETIGGQQTFNNLHYGFQGLAKRDRTKLERRFKRDFSRLIAQHGSVDVRFKLQMTREAFKRRYTVRNKMPDDFSFRDEAGLVTFWTDPERVSNFGELQALMNEIFFGSDEERADAQFESYNDEILILEAEFDW